ncbi:MAG TPA: disulfide bond formation protein B [Gammaproteobacteria bacterium]|nr:disulfide bond formation protein B [Gammaproteobacteria bacterium]
MKRLSQRRLYLIGFLFILALLGIAFYLQQFDGFAPCPLCILQRITLALLGMLFFIGSVFSFKKVGTFFWGMLTSLVALLGVFLSGRQVWLQHLPPDKNADCGASLQYLIHVLPFDQIISRVLTGTAECGREGGTFFLLSLADWSLLCFIGFFIFCLFLIGRQDPNSGARMR